MIVVELRFNRAENQYVVINEDILDPVDYMYPTYVRLTEVLAEVLRKADRERERLAASQRRPQSVDYRTYGSYVPVPLAMALYEYGNNVIAISGRRGQGKTSAMLSLTNALAFGKDDNEDIRTRFAGRSFLVLDPIDPTVLENHTSALMLILSRMYRKVEEAWEHYLLPRAYDTERSGISDSRRNELVDLFQSCFAGIRAVKLGEEPKSLASLHSLSDSSQLKVNLYNLVEMLLDFCIHEQTGRRSLVIQLDDTDFQIGKGFEVLDDIRKYLTLPNVVIVMATDMDLMYKVVAQHFFKEMEEGIKYGVVDGVEIENNAHKFLDKLVPPKQIVYLPSLYHAMSRPDDVVRLHMSIDKKQIIPRRGEESLLLEDLVLRYLYRKTGILCVSREGENHGFIPTTLRGLIQLLDLLASLEDISFVDDGKKELRADLADGLEKMLAGKEHNLKVFEDYLLSTWVNAKFSTSNWMFSASEVQHIMKRIADGVGLDDVCRHIITTLNLNGHLRGGGIDSRQRLSEVEESQTAHGRLFRAVSDAVVNSVGQVDYRFAAAVYMSVALRWHKAVTRQMRAEMPAFRACKTTYAFNLAPERTGLPKSFWLRGTEGCQDIANGFQESLRYKMESGTQKGTHARLNEILAPNNEFRVMHIVQALLSMAETVDSSPLIAYSDISQKSVYNAQEAMLVIACNPELQRELILAEEEMLFGAPSAPESQKTIISSIIGALNRREIEVNMGRLALCEDRKGGDGEQISWGQTVLYYDSLSGRTIEQLSLIPAEFRFDLVSYWITPGDNETETSLASWFISLQSVIGGGPEKLAEIYRTAMAYIEMDDTDRRALLWRIVEMRVAVFIRLLQSMRAEGGREIQESLAALRNLHAALQDEKKTKKEKAAEVVTSIDKVCDVLSYDASALKNIEGKA